jgi:glycosyltransferase involved in cell wall biosynthesis
MRRVLVVNLAVGTPDHGPTYRTHHLAELWASEGHDVTVVGVSYSHLMTNPQPIKGLWAESRVRGVRYILLNVPRYRSVPARVLNFAGGASLLSVLAPRLARTLRPDLVIAATVHQLDNFAARAIARRCDGLFVRETRDLWPLTLTALGGHSKWHPLVRLIGAAERVAYRDADFVCTTLDRSWEYMGQRGLSRERFRYLPQCPAPQAPEDSAVLPSRHEDAIRRARSANRQLAVFMGSFVPAANLPVIVGAARSMAGTPMQFLLIGHGPMQAALEAMVRDQGMDNVLVLPAVPKATVVPLLKRCDVGLVATVRSELYQYGVSMNKLFDYLAAGLPVVLSADMPGSIVELSGAGVLVPPDDPAALAAGIERLLHRTAAERQEMGLRGRAYLEAHHDLRRVADQYLGLQRGDVTSRPVASRRADGLTVQA